MEQIIRPLLILELTDSAVMVGLVVAARMVPMLLFGLVAGVAADRLERKRILLVTQSVTLSMHALMAGLVLSGGIEPWHVFATTFVSGTSMAFNQPARQSLIPRLVPQESLLNAVALNTMAINIMRVAGPGIAGSVLLIGFGQVYVLNAAVIGGVMLCTLLMQVPHDRRSADNKAGWVDDLRESLAYVGGNPQVLALLGPALILFVFGFPYQSVFIPLFAKRVLDIGNTGAAVLVMMTGAGAIIASLVMASQTSLRRRGALLLLFLAMFSMGLIIFSRSTLLPVSMVALMATASMSSSYMSLNNSLLLELAPREMHGRIMSLMSLDRGLIPLGATLAGLLSAWQGPQDALLMMASVCLLLTFATALAMPAMRRL
jgi:MFS family permease